MWDDELLSAGIAAIGADLSTGCAPDCWWSTSRLQPSALFALAMPPLATVTAHIALQGVLALLNAPTRLRSPQHRADLLTTHMRQRPTAQDPILLLFWLPLALLTLTLALTHLADILGQWLQHTRQHLAHPLRFLLLQPPRDQVQLHHTTGPLPVLMPQLMQMQALFEPFEEQLNLPSRSIQRHQVSPAPLRSLGRRDQQHEVGPPHQLVVVRTPVLLAQPGLFALAGFLGLLFGQAIAYDPHSRSLATRA